MFNYDVAYQHICDMYQKNGDLSAFFCMLLTIEPQIELEYKQGLSTVKPLNLLTVDDLVQ